MVQYILLKTPVIILYVGHWINSNDHYWLDSAYISLLTLTFDTIWKITGATDRVLTHREKPYINIDVRASREKWCTMSIKGRTSEPFSPAGCQTLLANWRISVCLRLLLLPFNLTPPTRQFSAPQFPSQKHSRRFLFLECWEGNVRYVSSGDKYRCTFKWYK